MHRLAEQFELRTKLTDSFGRCQLLAPALKRRFGAIDQGKYFRDFLEYAHPNLGIIDLYGAHHLGEEIQIRRSGSKLFLQRFGHAGLVDGIDPL